MVAMMRGSCYCCWECVVRRPVHQTIEGAKNFFPSLKSFTMSLYALLTIENTSDGRDVLLGMCIVKKSGY